jgi:small subunit ribosomal protein S17
MGISANRKTRVGVVVSDKMDKTVTVVIERLIEHPLYHKVIKKRKKVFAHDENNNYHVGDKVEISEIRPLSRSKRWKVDGILGKVE